jgi:hypothetical protein
VVVPVRKLADERHSKRWFMANFLTFILVDDGKFQEWVNYTFQTGHNLQEVQFKKTAAA